VSLTLLHKLKWLTKVAEDKTLRGGELRVATLLADYYNLETGRCFPTQSTLAKRLGYTVRQTSKLMGNLYLKRWVIRTKWGNQKKGSNTYKLNFECLDGDKDIEKYSSNKQEKLMSKNRNYSSYETNKETNYKTIVKEKNNLEMYVSFVERGQRLPSISDDMVDTMFRRGLISNKVYNKW